MLLFMVRVSLVLENNYFSLKFLQEAPLFTSLLSKDHQVIIYRAGSVLAHSQSPPQPCLTVAGACPIFGGN